MPQSIEHVSVLDGAKPGFGSTIADVVVVVVVVDDDVVVEGNCCGKLLRSSRTPISQSSSMSCQRREKNDGDLGKKCRTCRDHMYVYHGMGPQGSKEGGEGTESKAPTPP
jgi:hypothetical protein